VKETVNSVRREDLESDFIEGIWLEILFPNNRSILIGNFYRSPEGSLYLSPHFDIELLGVPKKSDTIEIISLFLSALKRA
jgi:hypothetical protein